MIPPIIKDAVVYANLILMLTIGFTTTYLTAKIPNFAHGTFAAIGIYVTFHVTKIWRMNPYIACPIAFVLGAIVSTFLYVVVIGTLKKFGATPISLTISTLALQIILSAMVNIYADWIREATGVYSRVFLLRYADFKIGRIPGVLIVSTIMIVSLIVTLHLVLTRTKFGIAMRATVENAALSSMLGINTEFVNTVSWAITGGLAGLAGSLFPLWFQSDPTTGGLLMTSVFAASVLGGIQSVYGAMIGGYIVGLGEVLGTSALSRILGPWVAAYRTLIPLTILSVVLLIAPRGILGLFEEFEFRRIFLRRRRIWS